MIWKQKYDKVMIQLLESMPGIGADDFQKFNSVLHWVRTTFIMEQDADWQCEYFQYLCQRYNWFNTTIE
jgi:hypothetical protein